MIWKERDKGRTLEGDKGKEFSKKNDKKGNKDRKERKVCVCDQLEQHDPREGEFNLNRLVKLRYRKRPSRLHKLRKRQFVPRDHDRPRCPLLSASHAAMPGRMEVFVKAALK